MGITDKITIYAADLEFERSNCELTLDDSDLNMVHYDAVSNWCDSRIKQHIWVYHQNKVYKLHDAIVTYLYLNTQGRLSNCALTYKRKEDVSRKTKIGNLLNGEDTHDTLHQYVANVRI